MPFLSLSLVKIEILFARNFLASLVTFPILLPICTQTSTPWRSAIGQRTLTIRKSITVQLVSSLTDWI